MKKLPAINSLVVFNHMADATIFRVKQTEGQFNVGVTDTSIEDSHPDQCIQWVDRGIILSPSVGQLKRHGEQNARDIDSPFIL